uniref:Uncharacterized protein n=1 Tax=Chromera velia CCMP2878 TaxID=1169474 RepID=A0A0G4HXD3_9ALVE|eukprot:Cvel_33095.t1-p1 / transcript=Cvel_33095.t1 / gene=Cvel_33095 / organism=Chromera_velia_CCMP2878 / gene_product=hypothetical protein / transcript_product=hypothetical protein / location=Cvel_scaffold5290:845-3562(-) / protein_length=159 / sequence_SO=supercontig / SO=protein_coding / is_pseudo=false
MGNCRAGVAVFLQVLSLGALITCTFLKLWMWKTFMTFLILPMSFEFSLWDVNTVNKACMPDPMDPGYNQALNQYGHKKISQFWAIHLRGVRFRLEGQSCDGAWMMSLGISAILLICGLICTIAWVMDGQSTGVYKKRYTQMAGGTLLGCAVVLGGSLGF